MESTPEHLGFLFLAVGDGHMKATGETPRAAALAFAAKYPTKRKPFDVVLAQDSKDASGTAWRYYHGGLSWRDVTRKSASTLPEQKAQDSDLPAFLAALGEAAFTFIVYYRGA